MVENSVSVIIPTMANNERIPALKRAICSVRKSSQHPVKIIVVVNGDKYDPLCLEWLERQRDVLLKVVDRPSAPFARYVGRCLVDTPFFATLDDDDQYLESALDQRIAAMDDVSHPDLVVTNGFFKRGENLRKLYYRFIVAKRDPVAGILVENWLNANNALYRAETVGEDYFLDYHPYIEFTWLGYKLALDKKVIRFLDEETFIVNCTDGSLSKSQQYYDSHLALFEKMASISPNKKVTNLIMGKIGDFYHDRSGYALRERRFKDSLVDHFYSIFKYRQLKYILYTRKIIIGIGAHFYSRLS
nr:glycosyltransferase family A protein [uncultured Desulfuromonas sp.]